MTTKKNILSLFLILTTMFVFGQQMTLNEWNRLEKKFQNLVPKYGDTPKDKDLQEADEKLLKKALEIDATHQKASAHFIRLGWNYFSKGDLKTAMCRFNQAFLADTSNTDIYWGYGAIYLTLGDNERAKKMYVEGLGLNPKNTNILTDFGTYFMTEYFDNKSLEENQKQSMLDSAVFYMTKSFELDSKNINTSFKLSTCYYYKNDCANAWKFYDVYKTLNGDAPGDKYYFADLKTKCKRD